ncbi:MAG TPA: Mur ligase family protein [Gemmatimonadaceae bacterium]|nr:Mur ligase family protein [Gemmatimonadaceae bacterium]
MQLIELARAAGLPMVGRDVEITSISTDSRTLEPGALFVAISGAQRQGIAYVNQALDRGALAVCASAPVPGVPTLLAGNPRRALAALAAAFHEFPARALPLIGITGSLGKTSTAQLLEAILREAGLQVGVIGSLGVRFGHDVEDTGMTTPEATQIHASLRAFIQRDADVALMEVTTHAIVQERVAGLVFGLGILTNLVDDEHLEFHPTPEHYIRTKTRFFAMLAEGAPLVLNSDDATVRSVTAGLRRPLIRVGTLGAGEVDVAVQAITLGASGSRFELVVRQPLMRTDGSTLEPLTLPLELSLLGSQQVANAALAITAALLAGGTPDAARRALATMSPVRRRMQVVHPHDPLVLDDTVGNPASMLAVFETAAAIPHERLFIVYAVRGARGAAINRCNAEALAQCLASMPGELIVTTSDDETDERNRVTDDESSAAYAALRERGITFQVEPLVRTAVTRLVRDAGAGDLVILLGAQGMDRGAAMALDAIAARTRVA